MLDALAEPPAVISRAEARAAGLKRYFTGKPCKNGHLVERYATNGKCSACRLSGAREWYAANRDQARESSRKWRKANPKEQRESSRRWRKANSHAVRKIKRDWYSVNREDVSKRKREYYALNRETEAEKKRQQYAANREARREKERQRNRANPLAKQEKDRRWRAANPEKVRLAQKINSHRRRSVVGKFTKEDCDRIMKAQRGRCAYCRVDILKGHEIDHILAIANGGGNNPANLQLLCPPCNRRKGTKDPIDFARSLGKLL